MKHEEVLKRLRQDPEYVAAEEELGPLLDFANTVIQLREERGWTQTELARRAGTRQANISRLENGLANPTFEFMQKIARALDVELDVRLLTGEEEKEQPEGAQERQPEVQATQRLPMPVFYSAPLETLWPSGKQPTTRQQWGGFLCLTDDEGYPKSEAA